MADGGEGTLDALSHNPAHLRQIPVSGAAGLIRQAQVILAPQDNTAILECAQIVGITDSQGMSVAVENRTTRGMGEAISLLLDQGCRRFLVGLGGSSTNDAGAGMLAALGVRFMDKDGQPLLPLPSAFNKITGIDASGLDARLHEADITVLSDVTHPLCGNAGATAVFGPQKGVTQRQVAELDGNIARLANQLAAAFGKDVATLPGAGAAGGLGYALLLLGANIQSGATVIARHIGLAQAIQAADWVITGEGRSDAQTLHGKAPRVVSDIARQHGKPITLLSGGIEQASLSVLEQHFDHCLAITSLGPISLPDAMTRTKDLLHHSARQLALLQKTFSTP